jgi:enterochelin esterase family protein
LTKSVELLEIAVGEKDLVVNATEALVDVFEKRGIEHQFRLTGGGHTWINWRQYMHEVAPKLFQ